MSNNIIGLPLWKKGATAAERLDELAQLAREQPELFGHLLVIFVETKNGRMEVRTVSRGKDGEELNTLEGLGVMAFAASGWLNS